MSQPWRILIVEDDPAVARGLQDGLEREGYVVTLKTTGADGVEEAGLERAIRVGPAVVRWL